MVHKLVEHNEMSANFAKENDLLCATYAKCIKKGMHNLKKKNSPYGICDRLKLENEVLFKRCKSLSAKSFDSCNSCHSDVGVFKIASSQPESDTFSWSASLWMSALVLVLRIALL